MGVKLGEQVGYSVRFDDVSSARTQIKFVTDGMLLRELLGDPKLSRYSYVLLDEVHERSVRTDILLGVVKRLLEADRREDLRVIVMSATLDPDRFLQYFGADAACLRIAGRTFPVRHFYSVEPVSDYVEAAVVTCFQIHQEMRAGDVLVFLTGQEEIEAAARLLTEHSKALKPKYSRVLVCTMYSTLPTEQQMHVFKPTPVGFRKFILGTNIAETSITIPGVRYVVDTGVVKQRIFNPRSGMESLVIVPISRSAAEQRAGRAGREAPGSCFRLYQESFFAQEMEQETVPEIFRSSLSGTILGMKAFGVHDVLSFPFLDCPTKENFRKALEELFALEAIDSSGAITELGLKMAEIPLSPSLAKTLICASKGGVLDHLVDIVAAISVDTVFFAPFEQRDLALEAKSPFKDSSGDHLTLLNVVHAYQKNEKNARGWCEKNFIHLRNMKNIMDIRKQLRRYCEMHGMRLNVDPAPPPIDRDKILRSLLCGFFFQTAFRLPDLSYKTTVSSLKVSIHPTSVLFGRNKGIDCVVYNELTFTSKPYLRCVSVIDASWLAECAPKYFGNH